MTQVTRYADDLTGDEYDEGDGDTIAFRLDGQAHEMDLAHESTEEMRSQVGTYVEHARKAGRSSAKSAPTASRSVKAASGSSDTGAI